MTLAERIEGLLTLMGELTRLVERENLALVQRRPAALALERDAKERLTAGFEQGMTALRAEQSALRQVAPALLTRLRAATTQLQERLAEHRRLVQAAKTVGERMVRAIARELDRREQPAATYDRAAAPRRAAVLPRARPLSLALNQVVDCTPAVRQGN